MKLIFRALFFSFLPLLNALQAKPISIKVYLNLNQCNNCNVGLNSLFRLSDQVVKNVYFPNSDKAASEELMEPFSKLKNLYLNYYADEAGPFKDNPLKSFCLVYNKQTRIDSFELIDLFSKSGAINALSSSWNISKTILLPESLKLSNRISVAYYNHYLNVFDYTLNKNVLLTLDQKNTKVTKVLTIKSQDFKPQPFLRSGIVDTAAYRIFYKYLNYLGKTKPDISGSHLADSSLYLFLTFPCAISPNGIDTGIGAKLFLYRKNLHTLKSELFGIPKNELKSPLGDEFYLDNTAPFYVNNNKVYFSVFRDEKPKRNYLLTEYSLTKDKVTYNSFLDLTLPDSIYTSYGKNDFFNALANHYYYFGAERPVLINTKTNKVTNLEKQLGTAYKRDLRIMDVIEENDYLRMIVVVNKAALCISYNLKTNSFVSEIKINEQAIANPETFKFLSFSSIMALDTKHKKILIFDLK